MWIDAKVNYRPGIVNRKLDCYNNVAVCVYDIKLPNKQSIECTVAKSLSD